MNSPLLCERVAPGVVLLTLNVSDRRNAMTEELTAAWVQSVANIGEDHSVRAVIVTGAGSAFCSGGDLSWLESTARNSPSLSDLRTRMKAFYQAWLSIRDLRVPSIAAVNGPAVGAGLCLALACDLRYASPKASFSAPFTSVGVHPGMAATRLLPEAIGAARARDMFLTGRTISADDAVMWGLASAVRDDVVEYAIAIAEQVAAADSLSTELMRVALDDRHQSIDDALLWEGLAQPVTMRARSSTTRAG